MKILAIIPARGGSKGIPRKNIVLLKGRPLIDWTIKASLKSKYIDKTIVSSDDEEILTVAKKSGAFPIKRPKPMASCTALPEKLIFHALAYLKKNNEYIPDILIYLQPTSPLRNDKDINKAIELFFSSRADGVISVCLEDKKYLKSFFINKSGYLKGIINDYYSFKNRQSLPDIFMPNGAIYIIKRKIFLKTKRLISKKTLPFLMDQTKSIDIDNMEDLKKVEKIIKTLKND